jgi:hypothetical protein
MEEMGFDLLRLFGCYFLFKEGDLLEKGVGFMSQERRELVGGTLFDHCKPEGLCNCKHFCH